MQLAQNQLIRSEVVMDYTLIDEFLGTIICQYFFGKKRSLWQHWRTKKFKIFNYHVVEELSLLKKLNLVREIRAVPNKVRRDIERLNALRNGLAHAFFPENLKREKPVWKGQNIFTYTGLEAYKADVREIINFFVPDIPHASSTTGDSRD